MPSLRKIVTDNVVDSTAAVIVANPALGFLENVVLGFSDELTLGSRIGGTFLQYAGIGYIYAKGRDASHRAFKLDPKTKIGKLFDAAYGAFFSSIIAAGILAVNGATPEEIAYGSVMSGGVGLGIGAPVGYAIDVFRDLCGYGESKRTPNWIRGLGRKAKLGVAALALTLSLGFVGGMMAATPDDFRGVKGYIEDAVYAG